MKIKTWFRENLKNKNREGHKVPKRNYKTRFTVVAILRVKDFPQINNLVV